GPGGAHLSSCKHRFGENITKKKKEKKSPTSRRRTTRHHHRQGRSTTSKMAAEGLPLAQLKLPAGPRPVTAAQRYWRSFKSQKSHTSTASWPISHISFPAAAGAAISNSLVAATKLNDLFAVTSGPRVEIFSIRKREPLKTIGRFDSEAHCGEIRADG